MARRSGVLASSNEYGNVPPQSRDPGPYFHNIRGYSLETEVGGTYIRLAIPGSYHFFSILSDQKSIQS